MFGGEPLYRHGKARIVLNIIPSDRKFKLHIDSDV